MCVITSGHPTHRDYFTPSGIVKHALRENLNKSSYISTMIICVNTAEIPLTDAGNSAQKAMQMYEKIKGL